MTGLGVFNILAAILQLVVPSYGLRLVRRFGAERVGWFLVVSFCSLAMLYFLKPLKPFSFGPASGAALDVVCVLASALLLIGMGHIETLFSERARLDRERERRRCELERELKEQTADLTQANQQLTEEIARREQREKALKESETQFRVLFADNPQPMWIFDLRSYRILAVNQGALRQYRFSREEFMGLTARDLLPAESVEAFLQDVARPAGAETRGVWRHCRKDLSLIDVEIAAADLKFGDVPARLVVSQDISQRRKRETESRETEKMETISRMAGGMAHHFNNLLTIIDGRTNLLLREPVDAKATEHLEQISAAANRAAGLTRQLLAVSGRHVTQKELLDLNGLLRRLSPTLCRLVGSEITLQENYPAQLPPIFADPYLLEPVIINLVLNGRDAMPSGGHLFISSALVRFDAGQTQANRDVKPGEFVRLAVRDTGSGITPDVQTHLFEPFFTTREVGRGTGLGLASVYGTLKQHGGWVEFSTEPGSGTEFRVFFPRTSAQESQSATPAFRETILLVEPDERARAVARYFLSRSGYRVIEVDSAETALGLWEGQGPKVDLLLTDLQLPGDLSGPNLAKRLRQTRPAMKVAYSFQPNETSGTAEPSVTSDQRELIAKPFTPERLLQAVQGCLNRSES